jgi:hypothetical protein
MPNGPDEIWRDAGQGAATIATALDVDTVRLDWPFGSGRFWFRQGERSELYVVGRGRAADD